ncbi:MAG: hypothetical protein LWX11_03600 [Firmicutes bacterium]|nr:hypothetical protein [Bacillota bacterium]
MSPSIPEDSNTPLVRDTQPLPIIPLSAIQALQAENPPSAPVAPEAPLTKPAGRSSLPLVLGLLALLLLGVGGAATYYLVKRPIQMDSTKDAPASTAAPTAASAPVPPELQAYLDKANQGDVTAMHMLGVMYYQGLNVKKNPEEGLKWYRKAAAAGSEAAKRDLEAMGLK